MRSVTNSMGSVVKGMDKAMESMNLERVSCSLILSFGIEWRVEIKMRTVCGARSASETIDEKEGPENTLGWICGRSTRMDCTRGDLIPG